MLRAHRRRLLSEREEGFTLAELIAAMIILAIILVALIGVQVSSMVTIADSTKRQQATAYANQAMEGLRALPGDALTQGNVPGFHLAGGVTDPYYDGDSSGGTVEVDGEVYTVRIATAGNYDLSDPRPPLYNNTGSNLTVMTDPAVPGFEFSIRTYIVDSLTGTSTSVGLLTVTSWTNLKNGDTDEIALRSSAFPSGVGCGDLSVQPYMVSCQDRFTFSSNSGYVSTVMSASERASTTPAPVLEGTDLQEFSVSSARATSSGESVQVSETEGLASRGGVTERMFSSSTTSTGYAESTTRASNNYAVPDGSTPDNALTLGSAPNSAQQISSGGITIRARADDSRTGTSRSSVTTACEVPQLPGGEPCTYTSLQGSGEFSMSVAVGSSTMHPMWRGASSTSSSGGGRFIGAKPGVNYGCQTLVESGCVAARASHKDGSIRIGAFTSGGWDEGATYLVEIADYSDSVSAQRGVSQKDVPANISRAATVRFWNGTNYVTVPPVSSTTTGLIAETGSVTWSPTGAVTVTATASVTATPGGHQTLGESPVDQCRKDVCAVTADAGSLTVSVHYQIDTPTGSWDVFQNSSFIGSTAAASYESRQ